MIQIVSLNPGDEFIRIVIAGLPVALLVGPLSTMRSSGTAVDPSLDLGYLEQGDTYDDAGNKFVDHVDLKGQVVLLGSDMRYEATTGYPKLSLTGLGFEIKGYRRSSPSAQSKMSGAAFVSGRPGTATLGSYYSSSSIYGPISFEVEWSFAGRTLSLAVTGESSMVSGGLTINSKTWSHTTISWDVNWTYATQYDSTPGTDVVYSDGRHTHQVEVKNAIWQKTYCDWMSYRGAPPTLLASITLNPALSTYLKQSIDSVTSVGDFWPTLCQQAILSAQYVDCNMIAMINDLRNLRSDLTGILENVKPTLLADIAKKDGWKQISSFFLGNKYGYQLTYSDATSIGEAMERLRQNLTREAKAILKLRSALETTIPGKVPITLKASYLARVSPNKDPLCAGIRSLYDWDIYPSLGNMWDLIPYSFVADWIVGVGDLLEDIDANAYMLYYYIKSITKSLKATTGPISASYALGNLCLAGSVSWSHYRRWGEFSFDPMPLSLDFHPEDLLGHWTEGTALWINKSK